jgi:hypothetical protein
MARRMTALGQQVCKWTGVIVLLIASCSGGSAVNDATPGNGPIDAGFGPSNVGAPCDLLADGGVGQAGYSGAAVECPTGMCLRPTVQPGAVDLSTTAFCTALCNQDSDCVGQRRDPADPLDTRCVTGFVCGVLFARGPICCQRVCLCRDFVGPSGLSTPIACQGDSASGCQ